MARQEQGEEDDTEVYVNRLIQDQLPQAITRKLLKRETSKDETLLKLMEDINIGKCRPALHRYQQIFEELTIVDGMVVRGEQLIIPRALQGEVIRLESQPFFFWRTKSEEGKAQILLPVYHGSFTTV